MWSAIRTVLGLLLSKSAAIILVALLVVLGTALYLFGQHHLEQRREEVERQRQLVAARLSQVEKTAADLSRLAQDREQIQAQFSQLEAALTQEQSRAAESMRLAAAGAAAARDQAAEVNRHMESISANLAGMLGPVENADWLPDGMQEQARRWREQLSGLRQQREQLEAQVAHLDQSRERISQSLSDFRNQHQSQISQLQQSLESLAQPEQRLRQQHQTEADALNQEQSVLSVAERRLADDQDLFTQSTYWLQRAWELVRWWLLALILTWLFGPFVLRLLLYYLWAPWLERAPPVHLQADAGQPLIASDSHPAQKIWLQPGEVAVVHERFLQSSDEPLRRRTQWLWSRRFPFTSVATGMVLMTRLANSAPTSAKSSESSRPAQLTLSSQDEEHIELATIEIPEGGALACRPRFIAAIIHQEGQQPRIRSRWAFQFLHSWITFQFRYFIFHGPVKLVLAAGRGIQVEEIEGRQRRTNEDLTVAFEPWLFYRSRRCETFIAYLRGQNPLFDDQFQGHGTFLGQQVRAGKLDAGPRRFWQDFFSLFFKALGL